MRRLLGRLRGGPSVPAPFVVASPRSGTTLLRMMLDAHPQLAIPPETHFVPELIEACEREGSGPVDALAAIVGHRRWGDFHLGEAELRKRLEALEPFSAGAALRAFYGLYAESQSKPRWGDKTPEYALVMRQIEAALPEARFIHVIRDGRDVALSRVKWRVDRSLDPPPVERLAKRWRRWIRRARKEAKRVAHYTEVRYEDLITDTEPTLRRLCEFAVLPWDDAVLRYHERSADRLREIAHTLPAQGGRKALAAGQRLSKHEMTTKPPSPDRVAAWRNAMDAEDRVAYERVAGDLLADLGYPVGEAAAEPAVR